MAVSFLYEAPTWFLFFLFLGLFAVVKLVIGFLSFMYCYFLRPGKNLRRYGSWAVVTGPTSGIGNAMAFELARKGINLVLVGRDPTKLQEVSNAICSSHPAVQTKSVVFDLSVDDRSSGISRLRDAIDGLDVGLLVNNAGVAKPSALFFHEVDVEAWVKMIRVNLWAPTEITAAVVPGMLKRRRGAVVNIGSGSAVVLPSFPLYSIYAATKRYIYQFSRSLYHEYKSEGIDVQCQAPLYVSTKMVTWAVKTKISSFFVPSSETYAQASMRWIGYESLYVPNFSHFLQWCFARSIPDFVNDRVRLREHLRHRKIIQKLRLKKSKSDAAGQN